MEYYFAVISPKIMVGLLAVTLLWEVYKHLSKKKLIVSALQSEEKRQWYVEWNSQFMLNERKLLRQVLLGGLPIFVLGGILAILAPELIPVLSSVGMGLLYIIVVFSEDYLFRKSLLKSIDVKIEREIL
jgi:hypothetical protein